MVCPTQMTAPPPNVFLTFRAEVETYIFYLPFSYVLLRTLLY